MCLTSHTHLSAPPGARRPGGHGLRRGAAPLRRVPGAPAAVRGVAPRVEHPGDEHRGVPSPEAGALQEGLQPQRHHGEQRDPHHDVIMMIHDDIMVSSW